MKGPAELLKETWRRPSGVRYSQPPEKIGRSVVVCVAERDRGRIPAEVR